MSRRPNRKAPGRSSRSRRSSRDDFPWFWLVVVVLVLGVIGGGFFFVYNQAREEHIELAENLCPMTGPVSQTVVLIDISDPITLTTQKDLLNHLQDTAVGIPQGGLIELRVLEPGQVNTRTLFSFCNPGDGENLNELTGNRRQAKDRWEAGFNAPLEAALTSSVVSGQADSSPLMGAIQEIALDHLSRQADRAIPATLIVGSDLLEHTDLFSMYLSGPEFAVYQASPAATKYQTDLAGAGVELWSINRPGNFDSAQISDFWAQWVVNNKGRFLKSVWIQG